MSDKTDKRYQDIAFFHIEKPSPPAKKSHPLRDAAIAMAIAVILIGIGYFAGLQAGAFEPSCCSGVLDFDFDFGT